MQQNARDNLRGSLPHLTDDEFNAAYDAFRRYARLAIDVAKAQEAALLTAPLDGGRVSDGEVDPGTFTTTR